MTVPLKRIGQTRPPDDLCEQTLRRQEKDGEIGRVGRIDIFAPDVPGGEPDRALDGSRSDLNGLDITALTGIFEPFVVL